MEKFTAFPAKGTTFILAVLWLTPALAWDPECGEPTFGIEFNFGNHELSMAQPKPNVVNTPQNMRAKKLWKDLMKERCTQRTAAFPCRIENVPDLHYAGMVNHQVIYSLPDGGTWTYEITVDPAVVEIKGDKLTLNQAKSPEIQRIMQQDIFDVAEHLREADGYDGSVKIGRHGLEPHGGGHIHIGKNAFQKPKRDSNNRIQRHPNGKAICEDDQDLFRDFVVDYANHPYLAMGGCGFDSYNAPAIAALPEAGRNAFQKAIAEYDRRTGTNKAWKISDLANTMNHNVYHYHPDNPHGLNRLWERARLNPSEKYQAMNVVRLGTKDNGQPNIEAGAQTLELRAINPQGSHDDFVLQAQLFQARLEFLAEQRAAGNIPAVSAQALADGAAFQAESDDIFSSGGKRILTKELGKLAKSQYRQYVEESGLGDSWPAYERLMFEGSCWAWHRKPDFSGTCRGW